MPHLSGVLCYYQYPFSSVEEVEGKERVGGLNGVETSKRNGPIDIRILQDCSCVQMNCMILVPWLDSPDKGTVL